MTTKKKLKQSVSFGFLKTYFSDHEEQVQRIADYDHYMQTLAGLTPAHHPDHPHVSRAADRLSTMAKDRESDLVHAENEHRVEGVQDRFPHDDLGLQDSERRSRSLLRRKSAPGAVLLKSLSTRRNAPSPAKDSSSPDPSFNHSCHGNPHRIYILEGAAQFTVGLQTQERYLFLFNDLLLIAKQKSSTTFKLKHRIRVCEIWLSNCLEEVSVATLSAEKSFVIGWPTTNAVVTFPTTDTKDLWLTRLQEQIVIEKGKEQPRAIILKVINKDMESYSASKCVTVGNQEDARALVERCLTEFHIQNADHRDYQLWVATGHDDAPYPLIEENTKRPKKTKRSPIINFFRRSQPKLDSAALPTGKLFGHSLSDISNDDTVPKPLKDLLTYLFHNAPFLPGVFRKPGNHKRMQEVRACMDNEEEIVWEDQPVLVATSILKEYLRSLPDCLFICDLFESWVDFLNINDLEERRTAIIKFLERLPSVNLSLLRHMMCVLYHIMQRSDENHMGAQALAVCISPSLLWQNETVSTGNALADTVRHTEESEKGRKLFQFLLENTVSIFGEETTSLFGESPSQSSAPSKSRQDSSTDSDSMHSMLSAPENSGCIRHDNSSIDSLDRDIYYTDPDPSPQMLMKAHFSPTNLSRDSGLTNSDPRLYEDSAEETYLKGAKTPIMRSVSHTDPQQSDSVDPGQLSRSYDATLDTAHTPQPVPPPRSRKSRKGGCLEEEIKDSANSPLPTVPQTMPALRHSSSAMTVSDIRRQMRHAQSGKRVSDDSLGGYLGSLDEDEDAREQTHMLLKKTSVDIGVIKKSSSGARIYVREEPEKNSLSEKAKQRQHRKSAPPEVEEVQKMLQQAKANVHQPRSDRVVPVWPNHTPVSRSVSSPLSPSASISPCRESPDGLNDSVLFDYTYMVPVESKTEEAAKPSAPSDSLLPKKQLVKSSSLDMSASSLASSRPLQMKQPHRHTPIIASEQKVVSAERPRSKSLLRSNAVDEEETLQKKCMTPTGSDLFPAHAMKKLYRKSLDETAIMRSLNEQSKPAPSSQHAALGKEPESPACSDPPCAAGVEKSASESTLNGGSWQRPKNPPSYQEAIQRQACLRSVSPQEIEKQRQKNVVAKKLYEDSLKKQQADERRQSSPAPVRELSPPCYETACQRAEKLKERKGTPPKYSKKEVVQTSPTTELLHKNSDQLKDKGGSRESTPTRSDSSREGSMTRKHRRRSKDRRIGHRNSDTKLGSAIKNQRQTDGQLNRSKSDSSELINKIGRMKMAKDNKENLSNEHLTTKKTLSGRRTTPERKHSLEKLEKVAKDLENEKMRRQSLSRSTENISFKSLTDNLQAVEPIEHKPLSRSVKNRNWHRDLAEQYKDNVPSGPSNVTKYSYAGKSEGTRPPQEGDRSSRRPRWSPIVHPTKDLVIAQVPCRTTNTPVRRAQSHVGELRHRSGDSAGRTTSTSPMRLPAGTKRSDSHRPSPLPESKPKERPNRSLGWSVSELRSLYAKDTGSDKVRAESGASPSTYVERTNPSAEEAYV